MSHFDVQLFGPRDESLDRVVQESGITGLFRACGQRLSFLETDIFGFCGRDMEAINNGFFDIFPKDFGSSDPDIVRFALLPKYFFEIFPREGIKTPFCVFDDRGRRRFSKGWNKAFGCALLGSRTQKVIYQSPEIEGTEIANDDQFAGLLRGMDSEARRFHILIEFQRPNVPEIHVLEKVQDVNHWHRDWTKHNQFYLDHPWPADAQFATVDCDTFEQLREKHRELCSSNPRHLATIFGTPAVTVTDNYLSIIRMEVSTQRLAGLVYSDDSTNLKANRFAAVFDADNQHAIPCPVYHNIPSTRREIRYT